MYVYVIKVKKMVPQINVCRLYYKNIYGFYSTYNLC